jgi:hypothetical protein
MPPSYGAFSGSTADVPLGFDAHPAFYSATAGYGMPPPLSVIWDQSALTHAFQNMSLIPPPIREWYMDAGADSHMTSDPDNLSTTQPPFCSNPTSIIVSNESLLPITSTGHTSFSALDRPLHLCHVLVSPNIIKNLISVRQFTTNNQVSVQFDLYGLSIKDLCTWSVIVRCNSIGRLYPLWLPTSSPSNALLTGTTPSTLWHRRLGHLGFDSLSWLIPSCNKPVLDTLCHACQLGHHVRLLFATSHSCATNKFYLIHYDLWTSPVLSVSGYKYYLIILDDYFHYCWTFPLCLKSDMS